MDVSIGGGGGLAATPVNASNELKIENKLQDAKSEFLTRFPASKSFNFVDNTMMN